MHIYPPVAPRAFLLIGGAAAAANGRTGRTVSMSLFPELENLVVDEHACLLVVEALSREMKRVRALAVAARDIGDRDAWALYDLQQHEMHCVRMRLRGLLEATGSPSDGLVEGLARAVRHRRSKMPSSKANRALAKPRQNDSGGRSS